MKTENLTKLKINKLTQAQYNAALEADTIQNNELYMVTDGVLDVSKGGTGATTVAGARNALGLGNTSGAVPIANGGTGAITSTAAIENLGVADYVISYGTSGIWTWEKWASGKAVAYMPKFYEYSNLTMKASGNLYLSEERYAILPSGLFVDNNYIVSHEFQSAGGPVSIIRQSGSTNAKFLFKIYKVYSSSTGVALKFSIKGRWKNDTERNL